MTEKHGGGGCCVAGEDVAWRMGRILLRYRPIAPKPLAAGTALGGVVQATLSGGCRERRRGGTRRQSGPAGGRRGRKSRKVQAAASRDAAGMLGDATAVVTLPLMPETPERKEGAHAVGWKAWESKEATEVRRSAAVVAPRPVRVVGVSVTVEGVSEAWDVDLCRGMAGVEEIRTLLDSDDSPAFISDAENRVTWTNAAYRRMVVGGGGAVSQNSSSSSSCSASIWPREAAADEEVLRVALLTRGLLPGGACRGFTCMARVRYVCRRRGMVSLSSPCDVWRLEDGSLAWRLDVKAALSLSIRA
ncbi:hypothetical protein KSP39_PZI017153 [Platanthera zijinensis]|uniref:DUF7950 domain-containing protein n=1 Tax=Platanthera zijinensis TaxID=2320716 RepID=A0AAP0FZK2_9ASPA